jgi:uncharacterized protein (TIGR03437 family)
MKRACWGELLFLSIGGALFGQTSGAPVITGVSNNASGAAAIESGSWVSIYGTNLSATTRSWQASDFSGTTLPTTLNGVSVLINGKKAAVAYISSGLVNVQAPTDTATGVVPVQVTNANGTATGTATLANYAPGFFTLQGKYAAAIHNSDGVLVAPSGFLGASVNTRAAVPGETLQIFATGLGSTNPAVPTGQLVSKAAPLTNLAQLQITIGGTPAVVQYAGIVAPGEYQINLTVPVLDDGDQPIMAAIGGVSTQAGLFVPIKNSVTGTISVTLSPGGRTIRCGTTLALTVKVSNTSNQRVSWIINGITGGNATVGTVSPAGVYSAPADLPAGAAVLITATSDEDQTAQANITINLQNPMPLVTSVTPNPIKPGNATITVTGTGFANGAVIYLAGAPLQTTFVSDTQLTATTTVAMPVGRLAAVKVGNPNPGAVVSTPVAIPVRLANEMVPYADAVRFLQMTTWGPTPQDVVNLQTMGQSAWLAAQFAQSPSVWPDPNNTTENVTRLQTAFFNVGLTGSDQLRQRVAFALAQILVASAVKDTTFEQMVSYQRLLGNYAFDTYRNAVAAMTLNPAMGDFLDMVNNDKANPATGTAPNENYARELMQLMTVGLVQLDATGVPLVNNGSTVPEYDQSAVTAMAKVLTGWTYGQTPGFASLWPNQPYYFGPMTAFENHHDTTEKDLNLPIPCTIAAGGTAESDLSAALDCIFRQTNISPFVSYRLIQRLVMSAPSPAYVGRVAGVFQSSKGNLQSVVTAILTDPEAQAAGTGKLAEPILYATFLLRAFNAQITAPDALTAQATAMGQNPLAPGSVFSYFSPFYVIPAVLPPTKAPEFQAMNASTVLARANFAYRVATNSISSGITVDLTNLTDLANNPADLVEAINQALYRGAIDPNVRSILLTAANAATTPAARVRSVLYAAGASPQYEVQQ